MCILFDNLLNLCNLTKTKLDLTQFWRVTNFHNFDQTHGNAEYSLACYAIVKMWHKVIKYCTIPDKKPTFYLSSQAQSGMIRLDPWLASQISTHDHEQMSKYVGTCCH